MDEMKELLSTDESENVNSSMVPWGVICLLLICDKLHRLSLSLQFIT